MTLTADSAGPVLAGQTGLGGPGDPPARSPKPRLHHVDAMRPIKQVGVVSTHTLLFFAPAASVSAGGAMQLLHVTREAFLFVSACMLTYSYAQLRLRRVELARFYRRRAVTVGLPYLTWTLIYFALTRHGSHESGGQALAHLGYLTLTGYYQLYYLVVIFQFYLLFPFVLILVRRTEGHHRWLLAASATVQVAVVSLMHWKVAPSYLQGTAATREISSYQLYLLAGVLVAWHLDACQGWVFRHARGVIAATVVAAVLAEVWFDQAFRHPHSWLGLSNDPFQPVVIPFNIGAIACLFLLGAVLVSPRRSARLRRVVACGADNAYGVYLAQMAVILPLSWYGWDRLAGVPSWPVLCLLTVAVVYLSGVALAAVMARTPLAQPVAGRSWLHRQAVSSGRPAAPVPARLR